MREATHAVEPAHAAGRTARPASGADLIAARCGWSAPSAAGSTPLADLHRLDAEVARSRAALTQAAREREVIERLKRKRRADHDAEGLRVAQIALDEVALTVHRRGTAA